MFNTHIDRLNISLRMNLHVSEKFNFLVLLDHMADLDLFKIEYLSAVVLRA